MGRIKYFTLLFLFISCKNEPLIVKDVKSKPSKIDSLNSIANVESFVRQLDTTFAKYNLKKIRDSIGFVLPYCKGDFDNNGLTDLFVVGEFQKNIMYPFAFMNYGKDSIKIIQFSDRSTKIIPKVIRENNQDFLMVFRGAWFGKQPDKLIFKYGGFINYNEYPKKYRIEKIVFKGFDVHGEYEIMIDKSLNANFKNKKEYYGKFLAYNSNCKLSQIEYNNYTDLLNYMNFPVLEDNYSEMNGTDLPICELEITYDNGKLKHIMDHGMENNYSLKNLYSKFEALKNSGRSSIPQTVN